MKNSKVPFGTRIMKRIAGLSLAAMTVFAVTTGSMAVMAEAQSENAVQEAEAAAETAVQEAAAAAETAVQDASAAATNAAAGAEESFTEEALANLNAGAQEGTEAASQTLKKEMNILLVGQDARKGEGRQRSDTMVLCHVDTETRKVTMVSFMRDLYVAIPGHGSNRLNAAYAWGGFELLDQTLEQNFGVHVDYNVEANFQNFPEIIDALGGVDIELSSAEAGGLNVSAGMNHLDGAQALSYSRIRKIDSDFERTNRQRKVLTAMFGKFRQLEFAEQLKLAQNLLGALQTDIPLLDMANLVSALIQSGADLNAESYRVPADGAYSNQTVSGMAVLVPDLEANKALIRQWLGMEEEAAAGGNAAGGYSDAATVKKVQEALNAAGFNCGTADGISGPKTREAMHQYQQANGLEVTDQITDALLNAMGI